MFSFLKKKTEPVVVMVPKTKADYEKEIQEIQDQRQALLERQQELFKLMEETK